jgi:hypothetical protein
MTLHFLGQATSSGNAFEVDQFSNGGTAIYGIGGPNEGGLYFGGTGVEGLGAAVAVEIANGSFVVRTDRPGVKVTWQVTGMRQDAWANAHRIPLEVEKAEQDRGHYLHPELFGHAGEPDIRLSHHRQLPRRELAEGRGARMRPSKVFSARGGKTAVELRLRVYERASRTLRASRRAGNLSETKAKGQRK